MNQMFSFIFKKIPHLRSSARNVSCSLTIYKPYGTKAVVESSNQAKKESFVVSYLVNTCGFSPEKAISASNYVKFETPYKPDSVLSFLKNHGFTETQVSRLVQRYPPVLLCNPHSTLLPKIEFFKSLGFTEEDFTQILCVSPAIFKRSMENQLLPTLDFLREFLSSPEKIRVSMKRSPLIFFPDKQAFMRSNIQVLREMGVPECNVTRYVQYQPGLFLKKNDKFGKIIEEVKRLGFDPSGKAFLLAVHVRSSMSKLTWENKICVYKKWGLAEDEILEVFCKCPNFMSYSEEKIMGMLDFYVNRMGFKISDISKVPLIISYSLKGRIIPRCLVYQTLVAKGLLMKDVRILASLLKVSEEKFFKSFVECYGEEGPELLKLYQLSTRDSLFSPRNS